MKILNKLKSININILLIIFIIIQPIFDLKIFYNSFSTLIRVIFISLFFLYYYLKNLNKKKYLLLIYVFFIIIYILFHHLNAINFNSLVPGNFNYSPLREILYFIKMLCPFMVIFSIYNAKLSKNELFFIIKSIVLFISIIIVFSNLFLFSYGSYSDTRIKANFFEWFNLNSTYTYQDLASKGLFEFANQISAILLMFLPFIIYLNLEKKDKFHLIILCFNIFALTLLCTKVAVLGVLLVFIYTFLLYLIFNRSYIRKKNITQVVLVFIIYILLLPFNPSFSRMFERNQIIEAASDAIYTVSADEAEMIIDNYSSAPIVQIDNSIEENVADVNKTDFIENNYANQKINENFILNRYPYEYDVDFWYDILTNDNPNKSDYRYLEQEMIKRVVEINSNKLDKWFGITYTRVQNIFNIEKDFIMQYYSIGILGLVLFLGPYFVFLAYFTVFHILNNLKKLHIYSLLSVISILMIFAISYYSGNLLNSLSFTIFFTILFVTSLNNYNK